MAGRSLGPMWHLSVRGEDAMYLMRQAGANQMSREAASTAIDTHAERTHAVTGRGAAPRYKDPNHKSPNQTLRASIPTSPAASCSTPATKCSAPFGQQCPFCRHRPVQGRRHHNPRPPVGAPATRSIHCNRSWSCILRGRRRNMSVVVQGELPPPRAGSMLMRKHLRGGLRPGARRQNLFVPRLRKVDRLIVDYCAR